jgi:uncharacterized protein YpiB (UPF0302 family)
MDNNETKQSIADLSLKLIDAIAFPGNKDAQIVIYKNSEYLYTITFNYDSEQYRDYEIIAQNKNDNNSYLLCLKDKPDTIHTLRYLENENDIHTFLIKPEYQKMNTGELLKNETNIEMS